MEDKQTNKPLYIVGKSIKITLQLVLFLILPVVIFTLITSRTDLIPGIKSFVVLSGSMEPVLPVGSIVYTKEQSTYIKGDIISFSNGTGQTVTHRIAEVTESGFVTKGDANNAVDNTPVTSDQIVGSSLFTIPYVGNIMNFVRTPVGFIAFIVVPSVLFILSELWTIKKELEKEIEKKLLKKIQQSNA